MKIRTLAALACLIAVTVGCYPKGSASVPDVKELFDSNRDAYVAVLNAALAAPTPRNTDTNTIYRRNSAVFETVVPLPPFLGVSLPPTNSVSRPVTIDILFKSFKVATRWIPKIRTTPSITTGSIASWIRDGTPSGIPSDNKKPRRIAPAGSCLSGAKVR